MTDDYGVDLDEILRVIDRAAVLIVRFDVLEPRLLVDFRADPPDTPIIQLVDRVNSAEERFRHLKSLRPKLPLPERIMSFPWPRAISAFEQSGIWEKIEARLVSLGADQERIDRIRQQLQDGERAVTVAAITGGEGFRTIWERQGSDQ
jgi:hypothetical protein